MAKLDREDRMSIKSLARKGCSNRRIAHLLGVTEGAVRYHRRRIVKPKNVGPVMLLGFRVVDSCFRPSSIAGIARGSCHPATRAAGPCCIRQASAG